MRIWIDTDIGTDVDDALALGYVLRHPGFELTGVSTVFGDVDLRARIALALLHAANAPGLPVLPGLGVPLSPGKNGVMLGHEGQGVLEDPQPRLLTESESGGAERIEGIADAIAKARPDVLLAIGPLTNLGALVQTGAELPQLAIMGGKLDDVLLPGMTENIFEWNWFCDPLAAQLVIAAGHGVRPRVVPAEITFRTKLEDGDVERLAAGDALAQALATLSRRWLRVQAEAFKSERPLIALHDPLTAAVLVEASLCPFEAKCIRVDDAARVHLEAGEPNVDAAVDVDSRALRDHLMETWLPEE